VPTTRALEENARRYPIAAWKVFTHYPDAFGQPGNAWRLDDADDRLPRVGHAFIEKARELGIKIVCAHKGFGAGSRYASPEDVPRAAKAFRDVQFIVYHAGFERVGPREGPYTAATARVGINRLITAMKRHGIGPNENVHAELGSTWWTIMRDPQQAAHVLGKLRKHVGRGQCPVGHRLHLLRLPAGPDPGAPGLSYQRGVPGALRLPGADAAP
jgi:predicted TIM-barrel fold metal-dependent hydrolase